MSQKQLFQLFIKLRLRWNWKRICKIIFNQSKKSQCIYMFANGICNQYRGGCSKLLSCLTFSIVVRTKSNNANRWSSNNPVFHILCFQPICIIIDWDPTVQYKPFFYFFIFMCERQFCPYTLVLEGCQSMWHVKIHILLHGFGEFISIMQVYLLTKDFAVHFFHNKYKLSI